MNLVEKLLAVDKGEFDKIETKKLKSKQLSKIVGEDAEVTIQAVDGDLFGGLSASGLDEEGEVITAGHLVQMPKLQQPELSIQI